MRNRQKGSTPMWQRIGCWSDSETKITSNQKAHCKSTWQCAFLSAPERIRTPGTWRRRTTARRRKQTLKREFADSAQLQPKQEKPFVGYHNRLFRHFEGRLHSSGQMVVKMQINSVRTYGKNTFNKFQRGSFNSILNIFHRRQLLFQFPGKVTRNLISGRWGQVRRQISGGRWFAENRRHGRKSNRSLP